MYSSTATFVWSRNTVRKSPHISFFCGGDPFYKVVRRPENTYEGADRFAWVTSGTLTSLSGHLSLLLEWPADLCLESRIIDLILSFHVWCENMNILFASRIFCLWLVIGTYKLLFFSGNLLILSANGNISHSIHRR